MHSCLRWTKIGVQVECRIEPLLVLLVANQQRFPDTGNASSTQPDMHFGMAILDISIKCDTQICSQLLHTILRNALQQLLHTASTYGINFIRCNFCQGNQHKCTLCHARMRNSQTILCNAQIIIKKNIDIDRPRTIAKRGLATERLLNLFDSLEQFLRRKPRLAAAHHIQKACLLKIANRLGFIDR